MSELFERNPYYEDKIVQKEKKLKYSLDVIEDSSSAGEKDIKLNRKEVIDILKVCQEEGYGNATDLLKKHINRVGFKKAVISPFSANFYAAPNHKDNSCFVPSVFIPRLRNLNKIMPDIAEDGTRAIVVHEREHGRADALTAYQGIKNEKSEERIKKLKFVETLTDLQKINKMVGHGDKASKEFVLNIAVKEFCVLEILKGGVEILERENIEKIAIDYLKVYYLFSEDDNMLEEYKNSHDYLGEFIKCKKEGSTEEFYGAFLDQFRMIKENILKQYGKYMAENKIPDLYDREDRECEDLRVKIINRLNQEKII